MTENLEALVRCRVKPGHRVSATEKVNDHVAHARLYGEGEVVEVPLRSYRAFSHKLELLDDVPDAEPDEVEVDDGRCEATTQSGNRCRNAAGPGGLCSVHAE